MTDDDEAPTPKESGSLAIFEETCNEAIGKLAGDDGEIADALRHEARQLLVELRSWKTAPPDVVARANVISRVMDLHRAVSAHRLV